MKPDDIIKVEIQKNFLQVSSKGYFNSCCFIFNSNTLTGFYKIESINDVLELGLSTRSNPYIFSLFFLNQKGNNRNLYLQGRHLDETWESAYDRSDKAKYYFLSIENKNIESILNFNTHIEKDLKLQFFSNFEDDLTDLVKGRKIVWWRGTKPQNTILSSEPYPIVEKEYIDISYGIDTVVIRDPYNRVGNYDPNDGTLSNGVIDTDYLSSEFSVSGVKIRDVMNVLTSYDLSKDPSTSGILPSGVIDPIQIEISCGVDGVTIRDVLITTTMDTESTKISYAIESVKIQNYEVIPTSSPYNITWEVLP